MSEYNIQMNKYDALNAEYDQLYPQPMKHASTHAKDGDDPIAPSTIGAYSKSETDNLLSSKPNPNLLDNWYFCNPVNQRGQTSYSGAGYGIDRWICDGAVISENGLTLTDQSKYIIQRLDTELKKAVDGKTVTVSALLSTGELLFGTKVYAAAPSANEYFVVGTLHIVNDTNGSIMFWAAQKATIVAVKLELGATQTLAHQENGNWVLNEIPDYGEQLARCQRYFIELNPNNVEYNTVAVGVGWSGGTEVDFVISIPTTMRANPTIVNLSNFHCVDTTDISWHNFASANCYLGSGFIKIVGFIDASVSGRTYVIMCDKNSLKMHLSADL